MPGRTTVLVVQLPEGGGIVRLCLKIPPVGRFPREVVIDMRGG